MCHTDLLAKQAKRLTFLTVTAEVHVKYATEFNRKQDPNVGNSRVAMPESKAPKHDFGHFRPLDEYADGWIGFM